MPFKLNRYHRNYLFWIYPLIFIGLTIYAVKEDQIDKVSSSRSNSTFSIDSTLPMSLRTRFDDTTGVTGYRDSTQAYFDLNSPSPSNK